MMPRRIRGPLVLTLALLALVVVGLVVAGLFVQLDRGVVVSQCGEHSRRTNSRCRTCCGSSSTKRPASVGMKWIGIGFCLQPYYEGRVGLPRSREPRSCGCSNACAWTKRWRPLQDAGRTNRRWLEEVAFPLLAPKPGRPSLQLRGKTLVDHFRADMASIEMLLARREASSDARAQRAILWVGFFAFGAVAAVHRGGAALYDSAISPVYAARARTREGRRAAPSLGRDSRRVRGREAHRAKLFKAPSCRTFCRSRRCCGLGATYLPAAEEAQDRRRLVRCVRAAWRSCASGNRRRCRARDRRGGRDEPNAPTRNVVRADRSEPGARARARQRRASAESVTDGYRDCRAGGRAQL